MAKSFLPALLACLLCAMGCGPVINVVTVTRIDPDKVTVRTIEMSVRPHPKHPAQNPVLGNYLLLPDTEAYQTSLVEPNYVSFGGTFSDSDLVPVDFAKRTPGTEILAESHFKVEKRDYVLFSIFDYEERLDDIVDRVEGNESLEQSVGLLLEAVMVGLSNQFDEHYDLTQFSSYLRQTLPSLAKALYQIYWELRRSRMAEKNPLQEEVEWDIRLRQELSRYGLYLLSSGSRGNREENEKRLWAFLDQRLRELVVPRKSEVSMLTAGYFQKRENQTDFLRHIEQGIRDSFGSMENFSNRVEPMLPAIFGAFSGRRLSIEQTEPSFRFIYTAHLPGRIIETNGLQDLDGSIIWRFTGEDMALTGYRMWGRTVLINHEAIRRLKLGNFPANLNVMQSFYSVLLNQDKQVDDHALAVLRACVEIGNLTPLRQAANPADNPGLQHPGATAAGPDRLSPAAAQRLLGILGAFYDEDEVPALPPAEMPALEALPPPEIGR
jgi:hypothetical protein